MGSGILAGKFFSVVQLLGFQIEIFSKIKGEVAMRYFGFFMVHLLSKSCDKSTTQHNTDKREAPNKINAKLIYNTNRGNLTRTDSYII
jgi:hypothetical protein